MPDLPHFFHGLALWNMPAAGQASSFSQPSPISQPARPVDNPCNAVAKVGLCQVPLKTLGRLRPQLEGARYGGDVQAEIRSNLYLGPSGAL